MLLRVSICVVSLTFSAVSAYAAERAISVPTDPRAHYAILSIARMKNGNISVVTHRNGPSGESFSRREINCSNMTFRYLGDGDTLAQMNGPYDKGKMGQLTQGSISTYVAKAACKLS